MAYSGPPDPSWPDPSSEGRSDDRTSRAHDPRDQGSHGRGFGPPQTRYPGQQHPGQGWAPSGQSPPPGTYGAPPRGEYVQGHGGYGQGQSGGFGQPGSQAAYGHQPQYGQPHYGHRQYGQPAYGQPGYGQAPPVGWGHLGEVAQEVRINGWATVGVCAMIVLSAFLPWVTGLISVSGIGNSEAGATDGVITLILALIAGAAALARALARMPSQRQFAAAIVAIVAGLAITLIAIIDIIQVLNIEFLGFDVGIGLWFTLLFGIALLGLGIAGIVKRR